MRIENLIYESPEKVVCGFEAEIREFREDEDVVVHTITTEDVDRYNTVVLARGLNIENYQKNPVVLDSHNSKSIYNVIGKAIWIKIRNDGRGIIQATKLANTEKGKEAKYLVKNGYVKASSIGFIPLEREMRGDITVFTKSELVEVSFVPVPGNPNALVYEEQLRTLGWELEVEKIWDDYLIRGVVRFKPYPTLPEDRTWNGDEARKRLAKWASSDGSGDKDKIDFKKYKEGFAWFDSKKPDNLGSYKLPHHDIDDGEIKTHWLGTRAAMGALFGARGGVDIPTSDRKGVYRHLVGHYKQFDKEPPEFREYSEFELIKLFPELYVIEFQFLNKFENLEKKLEEIEEFMRVLKEGSLQDIRKEQKITQDWQINLREFNEALKIARRWQSLWGRSYQSDKKN